MLELFLEPFNPGRLKIETREGNMFDVLALILFVAAFLPYWISTVQGTVKPAKATWSIWAVTDAIILISMILKGTSNLQIDAAVFCASVTSLLSLKYGTPGWTKTDIRCAAGAVIGLVLWAILKDPLWAETVGLLVLFIGSYPLYQVAKERPHEEQKSVWVIFILSSICEVVAMKKDSVSAVAEPITFLVIDGVMLAILLHASNAQNKKSAVA